MSRHSVRASFAVAGVLAVLGLLACVIALGAVAGSGRVAYGGRAPRYETPSAVAVSPSASADTDSRPRPPAQERLSNPPSRWIAPLVWTVGAVIGLALLVWLVRWAWWLLQPGYVRRREAPVDGDDDEASDIDRVARQVARVAEEQQRRLTSGDPRNAVVACWVELEHGLARAGVERLAWETSSEFTARALRLVAADEEGVRRLEGLYREARFSEHAVGEPERAAAIAALESIRSGLVATR